MSSLLPERARRAATHRRARLSEKLDGAAAIISSGSEKSRNYLANTYPFRASSHFIYLTGANIPDAHLLIDAGTATLFLDEKDADDAVWHGPTPNHDELSRLLDIRCKPLAELADYKKKLSPVSLEEGQGLLGQALISLRLTHDEAAREELREAGKVTALAHLAGMKASKTARTEADIRAAMVAVIMQHNLECSYTPIVTVHGEVLHNHDYHHACRAGDLLLADVGAESTGGFAGDVTRTWPISGQYTPAQKDVYEVVLGAQLSAIDTCKPDVSYEDVHLHTMHALAEGLCGMGILRGSKEERVDDGSLAIFFPHGVGHLLGLDVHDMEDLGDHAGYAKDRTRSSVPGLRYLRLNRDLQEHMAVTIEPGVYFIPALLDTDAQRSTYKDVVDFSLVDRVRKEVRGIRIEDDVLITASGSEILSSGVPKDAKSVEQVVNQ